MSGVSLLDPGLSSLIESNRFHWLGPSTIQESLVNTFSISIFRIIPWLILSPILPWFHYKLPLTKDIFVCIHCPPVHCASVNWNDLLLINFHQIKTIWATIMTSPAQYVSCCCPLHSYPHLLHWQYLLLSGKEDWRQRHGTTLAILAGRNLQKATRLLGPYACNSVCYEDIYERFYSFICTWGCVSGTHWRHHFKKLQRGLYLRNKSWQKIWQTKFYIFFTYKM